MGKRNCPDAGTCHHGCGERGCFRVTHCGPLSGVYQGDEWPEAIKAVEAAKDAQPGYTLEGREIPDGEEIDDCKVSCIFCGTEIVHVNAGGDGWACGAVVDGTPKVFLYCNKRCKPAVMDGVELWRCGCTPDYTENVGPECAECRRPRAQHGFVDDLEGNCQECERPLAAHPAPPWAKNKGNS